MRDPSSRRGDKSEMYSYGLLLGLGIKPLMWLKSRLNGERGKTKIPTTFFNIYGDFLTNQPKT
jgi:hypothetical protein